MRVTHTSQQLDFMNDGEASKRLLT
jgi:hypothetical protein